MRYPFTDGCNSFWHIFFGFLAFYLGSKMIVVFFLIWQLKDPREKNLFIDIGEFLFGFLLARETLIETI